MKPVPGITSRCPKRIERKAESWTSDLGFCLDTCAAFHLTNALKNCEGTCDEYNTTVNSSSEEPVVP